MREFWPNLITSRCVFVFGGAQADLVSLYGNPFIVGGESKRLFWVAILCSLIGGLLPPVIASAHCVRLEAYHRNTLL